MNRKKILIAVALCTTLTASGQNTEAGNIAIRNTQRAISLLDNAISIYYNKDDKHIAFRYDPVTHQPDGEVSVWEYTAAYEAVNSVLEGLEAVKEMAPALYQEHHDRYVDLLADLFQGLQAYRGSLSLPSYTGRNQWSVYAVDRGANPADKNYKENVYDDQMWIMREDMRAYRLTGNGQYLTDAYSLGRYVLDGWDCTLDANGEEYGGITWGPGYTSKHACSNGPVVSPLVWLAEDYKNNSRRISYYDLNAQGTRVGHSTTRSEYFLNFARKVYAFHVKTFHHAGNKLFWDMCGGVSDWTTKTTDGVEYRQHVDIGEPTGETFSYNTGSIISGGADLFRLTGDSTYLDDIRVFIGNATSGFTRRYAFTKDDKRVVLHPYHDKYGNGEIGNAWFNDVLIRSFIDANAVDSTLGVTGLEYAQENLDYAYDNLLVDGLLPADLVTASDRVINLQQEMAFISVYAQLAKYQSRKAHTATGIANIPAPRNHEAGSKAVYDLAGRKVDSGEAIDTLPHGIYITGHKKIAR